MTAEEFLPRRPATQTKLAGGNWMPSMPTTKSTLSVAQKRLIETMQSLNFGRIEGLKVRHGDPVFQPGPRVVQDIRIGRGENGPRPELAREDFALKSQVVEMFDHLS